MKRELQTRKDKVQFLRDLQKGIVGVQDIPEPKGGLAITDGSKVLLFTDSRNKTEHFPEGVELDTFRKTNRIAIAIPHNGRERVSV